MTKLIDLTVDVSALLVRDAGDAEKATSKYNDMLASLHKIINIDWVEACIADGTDTYIDLINERIRHTFDSTEDRQIDSGTIINRVLHLLDRLQPPFDLRHDILVDVSCVSTDTDVLNSSVDDDHKSRMKECLSSIAVLNEIYGDNVPRSIMLLGCAPTLLVEVTSDIVFVSSGTHDVSSVPQPGKIKSVVQVCDNEVGFMKHMDSIDAEGVLLNADTVEDIQLAVRVASFKRDPKMKSIDDWERIPVPIIGDRFPARCSQILKSDRRPCGQLLEALIKIASGEEISSDQIRSTRPLGDLQPKRIWIGSSHRLNFWERPGKEIEVAWFCKKQKTQKPPYIPYPTVLKFT